MMDKKSNLPMRKGNRFSAFDYSGNGAYFVTICTQNNKHLFGNVVGANCVRPSKDIVTGKNGESEIVGANCVRLSENAMNDNISDEKSTGRASKRANTVRPYDRPQIKLSKIGQIIEDEIKGLSNIYDTVSIDIYVILPNHIHMIILINNTNDNGRTQFAPTISRIVKQFKGAITKRVGMPSFWQKSFHDRVIRNDFEYTKFWEYIEFNLEKWETDRYYANT